MKLRRILILVLLLAVLLMLLPAWTAQAASITVTTNNDVLDAAPTCAEVTEALLPGPDGVVSLREALCLANTNVGDDVISFAIPGEGPHTISLLSAYPQFVDDGTTIDGYTQTGAAPATDEAPAIIQIAINGTGILHNGLNITSSRNEIRGLAIYGFEFNGIHIVNYLGGIANDNVIAGNYIGSNADTSICTGNGLNGVFIGAGAQNNLIGGDAPEDRNLVVCNGWEGIGIHDSDTTGNIVSGNYIGTNALGTAALSNALYGVRIYGGAENNTIGGDSEGERNLISGNSSHGIYLVGGGNHQITGNFIGLDASGLGTIPNAGDGIRIQGSANNTVGEDSMAEMNFISGNDFGIWIFDDGATGNVIQHNAIGLSFNAQPLGNTQKGIHISIDAQHNTIGPSNFIACNGDDGIGVDTPTAFGNTITQNIIVANEGLGIDLTNGSNHGIAPPVILSASNLTREVTGTACPECSVEIFVNQDEDGEGMGFIGATAADIGGNFTLSLPIDYFLAFPYLTATATHPDDGTSEFSAVFTVDMPALHWESEKSVDKETVSPNELLTYTLTLSNTGIVEAATTLTDTLPTEVIWADNASASSGDLTWDSENNRLLWSGTVAVDTEVLITFQVRVNAGLPNGEVISNIAWVDDGAGLRFTLDAPDVTVVSHNLYLPILTR